MTTLSPKHQRHLDRLNRRPWCWFVTDARFFALQDRYEREAQQEQFASVSRVVAYSGPDYRIRMNGQGTWIRANQWQYEQAGRDGLPRSIWDAPEQEARAA